VHSYWKLLEVYSVSFEYFNHVGIGTVVRDIWISTTKTVAELHGSEEGSTRLSRSSFWNELLLVQEYAVSTRVPNIERSCFKTTESLKTGREDCSSEIFVNTCASILLQ
jgi:hypothetical protein